MILQIIFKIIETAIIKMILTIIIVVAESIFENMSLNFLQNNNYYFR